MTERDPVGARLERELRGMLGDRVPGPAPYGLRGRVDRIPDEVAVPRRRTAIVQVAPLLAAAAVVGAMVVALAGIGRVPGDAGSGPSTAPGGAAETRIAFDPMTTGVGVVSPWAPAIPIVPLLVAVGAATLLVLAGRRYRGRRRARSAAWLAAAVVASIGVAGILVAPPVQGSGWATTEGTALEATTPGQTLVRVTAGPGEPFQVAITIANRALLPIRIEGFVDEHRDAATGRPTMSAWFDRDPAQMGSPEVPFEPFELAPGAERTIEIVRIADRCAIPGIPAPPEALPVRAPSGANLVLPQASLRVRWSVLSWPREDDVALPFQVDTYLVAGCDPTR